MRKFPNTRLRRNRELPFIRKMVSENHLIRADLIYPIFLIEGKKRRQRISSMPGIERMTIDEAIKELSKLCELGLICVALFPNVEKKLRSERGEEAFNPKGLIPRAVSAIKKKLPQLGVITDAALDPYTTHGQDGVLNSSGYVANDETIISLCEQAKVCAEAGSDIIAPSDMMDGRVGAIRAALDESNLINTRIMSYSAKYASAYYGPFREAVGSMKKLGSGDKKTYQMDPANIMEALHEVALDLEEGSDMVMVKPGMPYLDVIKEVKNKFKVPTFAYQVSGEYSMLKLAISKSYMRPEAIDESLLCFKRAGADGILTYFAKDWLLRHKNSP